jgi:hypothetical protein
MPWLRLTAVANGPRVELVSRYESTTTHDITVSIPPTNARPRPTYSRCPALRLNDSRTRDTTKLTENGLETNWG